MEIAKTLNNWSILSMLEPEFISNIDMVVVHGNFSTEALIVTRDRMVYALGHNNHGCSGIGKIQGSLSPTKVAILCEKNIKTFAHANSSHVLALTLDGKVYSWGNNSHCQLGNKPDDTNFSETPALVQENLSHTFVVDIACGRFHCLALTGDGEVYEWGKYKHEQSSYTDIMTPRRVRSTFVGKIIVCISCGDSYSMAVTSKGEVYGWGDNKFGQLGIGNYNNQEQPSKITELTGIVIEKVVCGSEHTLALSNEGILYTWGANNHGQLGCGTNTKVSSPVQVEMSLVGRVLDMAASHYNDISVAVGENNRVFVWGHTAWKSISIPTLTRYRCLYDALACYAMHNVTHKPFLLHVKGKGNLTDCLKGAFDDPTTSDLTIQVNGRPIHVHKAILKMRCQHFRIMFQEHWAEHGQSVMEHKQFSYNVYGAFLKYLYTNEINVPIEDALEFLDLMNAYFESQLQSRWTQLIKKDITVTNAINLYNAAILYNAKELEDYCVQFVVNHLNEVVLDELDELTKISFTTKAANAGASSSLVTSYQNVKMTTHNLMKWKIIRSLDPTFISKIHMVIVHGLSGNAALIVTKDGIVYGLGNNESGHLGTGDTCSTLSLIEVKALSGKGIKTFAFRRYLALALTEKGEIYSWGCTDGDQLSDYKPTSPNLTPILVEGYPSEVLFVDIACGRGHSLALTNDGKVYAWGQNTYGQVDGSRSSIEYVREMVGVIFPSKKILYIGCCSESSMAVTDTGKVYSWGCNYYGQLGRGNNIEAGGLHTVRIPIGVVIKKIACGDSHILALSKEGVLYVWGSNNCGQLGVGHISDTCTPVELQVREMGRVVDVAASPYNDISVAMCEHNRVFVWGLCTAQQLLVPTRIPFDCFHDVFAHLTMDSPMHQPLIINSEEEITITDQLRQAFDDAATSDLTIRVGGKPIHVHKVILRIRSQYFRALFQEHNSLSVIEHEKFCYDVYRAYLEYLYTDEIYLLAKNMHELLDLAVTYSDSVLRDRCISLSISGIAIDNLATIYNICLKHDLKELEQLCFALAVNSMNAVVQTPAFLKLDLFTTQSLIIKTAKARTFRR